MSQQENPSQSTLDREARVAATMRENLKRRKEQQRAREEKQAQVNDKEE